MMLFFHRHRKLSICISQLLVLAFLNQLVFPNLVFSQAQGPGQVEHQGFSPSGSSEMVNLFTGDFNYSIPLMEVDGYPLVLGYNGDVKMEQEASWVGLGWSLNPGAMSRGVRGLPDDFKGDTIHEEYNLKAQTDVASENGIEAEATIPVTQIIDKIIQAVAGGSTPPVVEQVLSLSVGLSAKAAFNLGENSYTKSYIDLMFDQGYNLTLTLNPQGYGGYSPGWIRGNSLGVTLSSRSGIGLNPSSLHGNTNTFGVPGVATVSSTQTKNISANYSTRGGLSQVSITQGSSLSANIAGLVNLSKSESGTTFVFPGTSTYTPYSPYTMQTIGSNFMNKEGTMPDPIGLFKVYGMDNSTSNLSIGIDTVMDNKAHGYLYHAGGFENDSTVLLDFNRGLNVLSVPRTMPRLSYAYQTYDMYSASGHGVNTQIRPFRNRLGIVYDPYRHSRGYNQTFMRRVARSPQGTAVSKTIGQGISWVANKIVNIPPFIDEFILKGGFYLPFEFENGNGSGTTNIRMGGWASANKKMSSGTGKSAPDDYERVYFKSMGEITFSQNVMAHRLRYGSLTLPKIGINVAEEPGKSSFSFNFSGSPFPYAEERTPRNTHTSFLTAKEAVEFGLQGRIISYEPFELDGENGSFGVEEYMDRVDNKRKKHHISEFTVLQPGGARYIYGVPVYNNVQKQVVFNVQPSPEDVDGCGMTVRYVPGVDNSMQNKNGEMNYYKVVETPPYASAFLLNAVLSPDYVDLTDNGPTKDDLGNYTFFRYTKTEDSYKWRIPYSKEQPSVPGYPRASYNEGYKNYGHDDMGTYLYGEKELWYVHSIEGKTQIAEFYLSPRVDGFGVAGEDGGMDTDTPLMKLLKIELYDKHERETLTTDAEPIKTVHFKYDYSLCPGDPTNSGEHDPDVPEGNSRGKLTLKKIWFTYGNSEKGRMSPYEFTYANNPEYDAGSYDRWGNYKPQNCNWLSNQEYPYSEQDAGYANEHASAWKLSKVDLPSGSSIEISYEADDYAHVQDLDAHRMFKIAGFGNTEVFAPSANLFLKTKSSYTYNKRVYFEFAPGSVPSTDAEVKDMYLKGTDYLYFKVSSQLLQGKENETYYGYAQIEGAGKCTNGTHGWVALKSVRVVDPNENVPDLPPFVDILLPNSQDHTLTNPIAKAGWQHLRLNVKELIYPTMNCQSGSSGLFGGALGAAVDVTQQAATFSNQLALLSPYYPGLDQLLGVDPNATFGDFGIADGLSIINCLKQYFQNSFGLDFAALTQGGVDVALRDKNAASIVDLTRSFIRLREPDNRKIGGGYRVTQITSSDGWGGMGGSANMVYGQTYDYTTLDEKGNLKTSGVAAYEPKIGNDENPWRKPVFYEVTNVLYPDDHHFQDEPIGENLFPAPFVGYSKVTVANLARPNVNYAATGHKVYEFYTAKDFPLRVKESEKSFKPFQTLPDTEQDRTKDDREIVDETVDMYAAVQCYVLMLNDMHGKPRSRSIYDASGDLRNSVTYHYSSEAGDKAGTFKLKNEVPVIHDGVESTEMMGREYDFTFESKSSSTISESSFDSRNYNISISFGFGNAKHDQNIYKKYASGTLLKIINEYGILARTEVKDGSSTINTENLLFDKYTGNPVHVAVQNDFGKYIYNYNKPAYWAYDGMGGAYVNQGVEFVEGQSGEVVNANGQFDGGVAPYFFPGDEILVKGNISGQYQPERYWAVKSELTGKLYLVDKNGNIPAFLQSGNSYTYKVIRSGRRNQQFETATSTTSLSPSLTPSKALSASATEFTDQWQMYCGLDSVTAGALLNDQSGQDWVDFFNMLIANGDFYPSNPFPPVTNHDYINLGSYPFQNLFDQFPYACSSQVQLKITASPGGCVGWAYFYSFYCPNTGVEHHILTLCNQDFPSGQDITEIIGFSNPVFQSNCLDPNPSSGCDFTMVAQFEDGTTHELPGGGGGESQVDIKVDYHCQDGMQFCGDKAGTIVNPYYEGVRGTFRPFRNYVYYKDARNVQTLAETGKDGQFNFAQFNPANPAPEWLMVQEITTCDPYGNTLESKDALGLYSASLMGFNYTKTVASAANAQYRQIAFDGFEDYNYILGSCKKGHLNFADYGANISPTYAHTGRYSFKLNKGDSAIAIRSLRPSPDATDAPDVPFKIRNNECTGSFSPHTTGKPEKYVLGYWVRIPSQDGSRNFTGAEIEIEIDCMDMHPLSVSRSNIIDGWQRVEKIYEFPALPMDYIKTRIENTDASGPAYFDDFRIQPYLSAMQTMVYDPVSLRLVASLDDRNFATFYGYDVQGKMVATKKETEKGIYTLNESRSAIVKREK